jgi:hypothetical protein
MNWNKSVRIILGAVLLMLVAGAVRWCLSETVSTESRLQATAGAATIAEPEALESATPRRPAVRFQPFPRSASVRTASEPASPAAQKLYVDWKGTWYAAEILASSNGSNCIRYSGYGAEWDEWVTPDRMRYSDPLEAPPQNRGTPPDATAALAVRMTPEPGEPVVLWGNRWWRAEVLQTEGDKSLIRYVGYGAEWDEWVGTDRFKLYSEEDARKSAATATLTYPLTVPESLATVPEPELNRSSFVQGSPAKGDLLVEWGNMWWPAEILKQEGSSYLIHYKGYGTNWDEWVTLQRIGQFTVTE